MNAGNDDFVVLICFVHIFLMVTNAGYLCKIRSPFRFVGKFPQSGDWRILLVGGTLIQRCEHPRRA